MFVFVFWVSVEGLISASMEASRVGSGSSSCFTVAVVGLLESGGWSGSELSEGGLGGSADMVAVSQRVRERSKLRGRREMRCASQVKMDVKSRRG
jgi:hypothetical protein